ncbi:MAG TPA: hypothetical protein VGS06_29040 [Streptosporangiaceae bacterium]|nr:hypothetical protein [Streptosporangiaceae bacterium]
MSYEPSHRKPPRQERWPNATPGEGWPAYQQGDGERSWASADALAGSRNGHATTSNGYGNASNGYGDANGGYGVANGYGDAWGGRTAIAEHGYGDTWDGRGPAHQYDEPARGYWAGGNGYGTTTTAYPADGDGYADGFDGAADGYGADGYAADGYAAGGYTGVYADGYGQGQDYYQDGNSWDGYAQPGHEFTAPAGYQERDEYPALEPGTSAVLVAPDTLGEWWRQPEAGTDRNLGRGLVVGAVMGILAAAVAIGVATFAAAFVRPQASPASVVGSIFIDRIPATLKHSVMAHFGAHDRTVLLLGMYGAIGLIAMVLGCMARRNPSVGVSGIAAFGLLAAFIVVTRPESRASDVIPSAIGAVAGVMALLWLARASAPVAVASRRPAHNGGRRRTR